MVICEVFILTLPFHLCISSWDGMGIYVCCFQCHHQGALEMKTVLSWDVPPKCKGGPPTGRCHWESACDNTEGPLGHRVGHRPHFPAEALRRHWVQRHSLHSIFPPHLNSSAHRDIKLQFFCLFHHPFFLHGHIQGDWLHSEIAGISSSGARVHAKSGYSPPSFVSRSVPIGCLS